MQDAVEVEFADLIIESIAPAPGSDEPGGETTAQVIVDVRIGEHTAESIDVWVSTTQANPSGLPASGWGQHATVTVFELDAGNQPSVVASVARYGEAGESGELKLVVGERATLGEVEVELRGHGHKTVMAGGSSPLMINLDYHVPGQAWPESQNLSLHDPMRWTWRNYAFEVRDYEYDRSMKLAVTEHTLVWLAAR